MYNCGMRQMEERHVANQVDLMVWSNKLDLLAISNFKGEVQIHRLHWQKVWSLSPPKENVTVQAMTWRPDGKALAVGYSTGNVFIVEVEDKDVLDKFELETENIDELTESKQLGITCITWAVKTDVLESATEYNMYEDASIFLQKLPVIGSGSGYKNQGTDENIKDFKQLPEQTQLSMLLVGYSTGYIYMSIFGRYPYGTVHVAQIAKDECGEYKVLDILLSGDFSVMQVFYIDRTTNNLFVALINTSVLSAYAEEMFLVASKHGNITQLMSYLDQTMVSITEAWEHILLEMDTKMAYYATSVPEGGVSADLLELLMLGVPSDQLELFLLQELTAKGLKKFGSSVELSYSTIQKLVLKQLNIVAQNLAYYLTELRGYTRLPDRFQILEIEESTVTEAIKASCAFLNKCLELQQVIDMSMRNYKAFFRWLFVVIVRLLDEPTPSEIVKITQQELTHIAEFLYNFDNVQVENTENTSLKPVKFNLERLGQYLQNQELTILPDDEDNPWHKFLKENTCFLKDNDTIFSMTEFKKFSLVQQQNFLKKSVDKVFNVSDKDIGKNFSVLYNIRCYELKNNNPLDCIRVSQIYDANQKKFLMAFMNTSNMSDGICFMSVDVKDKISNSTAIKYYLNSSLLQEETSDSSESILTIHDLQFYSSEFISVLVQHPNNNESSIFIQLPLKIALDNSNEFNIKSKHCIFNENTSRRNISPLLDQGVYKVLDKMDGFHIAVSGARKVSVVLSKSLRKVRVFEMEVDGEDEEDDTLETTPLSNLTHEENSPLLNKTEVIGDVTF